MTLGARYWSVVTMGGGGEIWKSRLNLIHGAVASAGEGGEGAEMIEHGMHKPNALGCPTSRTLGGMPPVSKWER